MSATFTTLPVEEGSTRLTTSPTVFKRDKKRALSVVAECPFGRSGTLRTTVKGSRLRSLEPSPERFAFWCANESQSDSSTLCPRRVQVPTQKQEVVRESKILVIPKISDFRTTLSSTSEGRVAPSAVGKGSSQAPLLSLVLPEVRELPPVVHGSVAESRPDERRRQEVDHQFGAKHR